MVTVRGWALEWLKMTIDTKTQSKVRGSLRAIKLNEYEYTLPTLSTI